MKENAKILLGIMRDVNRQHIALDHRVFNIIRDNLGVNNADLAEVTELIKADTLEETAMGPEFESIKALFNDLKNT